MCPRERTNRVRARCTLARTRVPRQRSSVRPLCKKTKVAGRARRGRREFYREIRVRNACRSSISSCNFFSSPRCLPEDYERRGRLRARLLVVAIWPAPQRNGKHSLPPPITARRIKDSIRPSSPRSTVSIKPVTKQTLGLLPEI